VGGGVDDSGAWRPDGHAFVTARTTLGDVVGFSTACFTPSEFTVAALACTAHGGNAVEIVCGESTRTDALAHACEQLRIHGLRPSLRARCAVEPLLRLAVPVTVAADLPLGDAPLSRLVQLRNTADPDLVDKALDAHPETSFCLDASLAFAVGGFTGLTALATNHTDRLAQVAVGAVDDDPHLQDLVQACFDAAGRAVPVMVERPGPIWSSGLSDEIGRLRALSRRFLTPYR
jgi:hypothetical protein